MAGAFPVALVWLSLHSVSIFWTLVFVTSTWTTIAWDRQCLR
jgi:hypothetical protein